MSALVIFAIVLVYVPASLFGYAILQPAAKAVRGKRRTWKFCVSDFFPLTFLLAIPLLFMAAARRWRGEGSIGINVFGLLLVAVFAYAWWRATVTLSTLGVLHAGRRCVFLGVLLPIALLGSAIGVPTLMLMTYSFRRMTAADSVLWLLGAILTPGVAWCCRRAAFWVLAGRSE